MNSLREVGHDGYLGMIGWTFIDLFPQNPSLLSSWSTVIPMKLGTKFTRKIVES